MTRFALGLVLVAAPTLGLAEVATLQCTGTSPSGAKQTLTISYDEAAGWVDDNGSIKFRDGVTPYYLQGIKVLYDRETRVYETKKTTAGEKFKGTCTPAGQKTLAANTAG